MRYMLLVYGDERQLDDAKREACYKESVALTHDLHASGQYLGASPLHPTAMATSVRIREGRRVVTDGPFAETREQLGGFYMVEAPDLDAAIAIAERIPVAKWGTVEIRRLIELGGMPGQ
jgi:hypothetical protein